MRPVNRLSERPHGGTATKWRFLALFALFRRTPLRISLAKHGLGPEPTTIAPSAVSVAVLT